MPSSPMLFPRARMCKDVLRPHEQTAANVRSDNVVKNASEYRKGQMKLLLGCLSIHKNPLLKSN